MKEGRKERRKERRGRENRGREKSRGREREEGRERKKGEERKGRKERGRFSPAPVLSTAGNKPSGALTKLSDGWRTGSKN